MRSEDKIHIKDTAIDVIERRVVADPVFEASARDCLA